MSGKAEACYTYTTLSTEPLDRTVTVRDWLLLDVDRAGRPVGLEILGDHSPEDVLHALLSESRW